MKKCNFTLALIFISLVFGCSGVRQQPQDIFVSEVLRNARRIIYVSPTGNDRASGSKGSPLASIQKAIDIAQRGDAVKVEPGTYTENIRLRSHISLVGSGADVTILSSEEGNIITADNVFAVTIEGFTLDGKDVAVCGLFYNGEQVYSSRRMSPIVFRENIVKNFVDSGINGKYAVITIQDNIFVSTLGYGVRLFRSKSKIKNNRITFAGIGIFQQDHQAKIVSNTITENQEHGIYCYNLESSVIRKNKILEAGSNGILCDISSVIIQDNSIFSSGNGISCAGSKSIKIRRNRITQNKNYGIFVRYDSRPDLGRTDDMGYNSIWGNGKHDVYSESEKKVPAVGNWWGSPIPADYVTIQAAIDAAEDGDTVLGVIGCSCSIELFLLWRYRMKKYSFTGGRPSPEDFPIQGLIDATERVLIRRGTDLIAYPEMNGQHDELKEIAAIRFENREGIPLPKKNIVITAGSIMAIEELSQFLAQPGDTIITEELSYMGSLGLFRGIGVDIRGIPVHPTEGMDMDALEDTLRGLAARKIIPKFIYTIPTYQNPTGSILTLERRKRMLQLAGEYGVTIIEDDCYGDIHFELPSPPPALYKLAQSQPVVYVGSFSKIIGPGLRLGYMCVPPELEKLAQMRIGMKVSGLASLIVAEYLRDNLRNHIKRHNEIIKEKRDVLIETLKKELGDCVSWNRPRGGLFAWLKLPESTNQAKLEQLAEQNGVEYTPGREFHYKKKEIQFLRLSYPHMSFDELREGVAILAKCIRQATW